MVHTEHCIKQTEEALAKRQAWIAEWPNHCKKCKGVGFNAWSENQSPIGSGCYWPETFTEFCGCVEEDKCPRCGKALGLTDEWWDGEMDDVIQCPHCGWDSENPDACPELPERPCMCDFMADKTVQEMYEQTYQELDQILKENS